MTLICVAKESESSLLIAADNLEQSTGGYSATPRSKLHRVEDKALAWACSGNATVGEWLSRQFAESNPQSWDAITSHEEFRSSVAILNGNERAVAALARSQPGANHLVACVMAGWLNGEPGIWDIDSEGQPSPHLDRQILFEGSVALHAHLIWDALKDSPLVQGG